MVGLDFTKMHGNGNDFVVVDEWDDEVVPEGEKGGFASRVCERRFGVGANGVLFVSRPDDGDVRFRLFQPDGDEVEMCGNGIRCLVRYAVEEGYVDGDVEVRVETPAGVRSATYSSGEARVEMGVPSFEADDVPAQEEVIEDEVEGHEVTAVNTGVPHAVVFVDDVSELDVAEEAPRVRHANVFDKGANVNFVSETREEAGYEVRTFERGVEDETLSCGTGAVAVAAAARRLGKAGGDEVTVRTSGGELRITFDDGTAYMEGPAERVYEGSLDEEWMER